MSLVTTATTKDRCIKFINKVREARFIKTKNRQFNKFNRLVAKSNRDSERAHILDILAISCQ